MDNGGDPPVSMQSWGARALSMFDEELQELEQLNQLEEESYHAELEQAKVQAMEDAEHMLQSSAQGGNPESPEKRKPPSAKGRGKQSDDAAFLAAKNAKILEERTLQLQEKSARQPWRQMAQHYVEMLEEAQRATKPVLQWERRELDFFTSHKLEYYTMGDVLAVDRPRPADAGDAIWEAEGLVARPNSAPPAYSVAPQGSAAANNAVSQAAPQISLGARAPAYVIDAVAFADDYNKALEKEYAYKVELGTHQLPVSSTHTAAAENDNFMRTKLATHKPGIDMPPDDFCGAEVTKQKKLREATLVDESEEQKHTFFLPALSQYNATGAAGAAATYSGTRGATLGADGGGNGTVTGAAPLGSTLSLPSLIKVGGDHAHTNNDSSRSTTAPATRKAGGGAKAGTAKRRGRSHPPLTSSTTATTKKGTATKKGKGGDKATDGIECSLQGSSLNLRTCAGETAEAVLRFTNRRAFRTRLRVLASTHSWLRYTCTRIAPAGGTTATAPAAYETPLSSGGFVEVTVSFSPQNMSTPELTEVLQMGVARELNSRDGEGAQWAFLEIPVHCETVAPTFVLRPIPGQGSGDDDAAAASAHHKASSAFDGTPREAAAAAANTFVFPHTIVLATSCILYELENLGSCAIVNLLSDSPCFAVAPGPQEATTLAQGQKMPLAISFSPKDEGPWEAHLSVIVRETSDGAVLAEHPFILQGEGVIPRVRVVQMGGVEMEDTGRPQWRLEESEGAPRFVLEQSTPGVLSRVPVVVYNDSVVPLPYVWRGEVGGEATRAAMEPAAGTLPPQTATTFTASVTPKDAQPLLLSWNMFLQGLPQLHELSAADLEGVPEDVLDFYSTDKKLVPSAAMLKGDTADVFSDPFFIFQHRARLLTEAEKEDCFATGLFLYSLPVMPQMVVIPQRLEEAVDCLIRFENARRVTLQNRSPQPLHFYLDPTAAEWPAMAAPPDREGIAVRCVPRTGVVPPFGDMRVTVYFTVQQVGPCSTYVNCYVPEMALRESVTSAVGSSSGATTTTSPAEIGCLQLLIDVTGAGPSVHTSTEYLDFGLVEMNKEVEASFTVTNDNPIAVEFDLQDPMMREPPRFVFLPPSFRLGPGDSIEVTVYRKGVSVEDEQTFFEIVVRDGATIAIETRATIQSAMMMVDKAQVNFHEVPEGEWQEGSFYLTNLSALDVPFSIEPGAAASPYIELDYTSQHTLHAGQRHVPIPLRARFFYNPAVQDGDEDALRTLIGLRNGRVGQILLVEIFCERVQRLAVDVQLTGAAAAASTPPPPLLLTAPTPTTSPTTAAAAASATVHYDPVVVRATLEEASPVAVQPLTLDVTNRSGCVSTYEVHALTYIDLPTVTESALEMIKKKKLLETASKPTKGPPATFGVGTALTSFHPTTTATAESAVGPISADRPTFWATAQDGTELQERRRREALAVAQRRLVDGRGCATTFLSPASGEIGAHGRQRLNWTLTSNFPGRYKEALRFRCGGLPELAVPVTYELRGRPLLLDPTTSGLTVEGDLQVLVMPSVIAPLGTSHRKLRLLNRVPRDVSVQVQIFLGTSTFTVVAVDEAVEAAQVTLTLAPLSEAQQQQDSAKGKAQVSPAAFVVRAMASVELTVEYTPEAAMVAALVEKMDLATTRSTSTSVTAGDHRADDSDDDDDRVQATREQETTWEGSLVITTELAETEYNDTFYMDEFYTQHASQYPSTRALCTTVAGPSKAVLESVSRPLQTLSVQQPLRTRPGRVIVRSRLLQATEPEQRRLQAAGRLQEAAVLRAAQHAQTNNGDDDDEASAEDEATSVSTAAGGDGTALRSVEELLAEQEERNALVAYVARRRTEAVEESRHYFLPVELRLRARCGVPRLAVQPSAAGVYFPPYQGHQQGCTRTVRLTNRNRATLHFQLASTDAAFEVVSTRLLAAEVEEDPLVDDLDDVAQVGRKSARQLQWVSLKEQQQAERMLHGQLAQQAAAREKQTAAMPAEPGALYNLRCGDAMDVLLRMTNGALLQQTGRLHAALRVDYPSQRHEAAEASANNNSTTSNHYNKMLTKTITNTTTTAAAAAAAAKTVTLPQVAQTIPLLATYVVAEVHCQPEVVWFRPGQTSHDGRAQPVHAQRLTLSNLSPEVVQFELVPVASADTVLGATSTAKDGRTAQLTKMRKLREVLQLQGALPTESGSNVLCVRDVPGVFQLSTNEGLLPPATAGGQPGTNTIFIYFREHSNVRYESAFCVYVNGSPTDTVVLVRGDSREPEI